MPRFCSSCGAQVADASAFCPACGKSVAPAAPGVTAAAPATAPVVTQTAAPVSGLTDNVAGLLAYLFIPAIIFLVVEPYNKNKFIRFHSWQSIAYELTWIVVSFVMGFIPFLWLLMPIIGLAFFIGWIVLAIKAYQGAMFKLPILGDFAEKQANSLT